jgi:ABC-type enterobactin transport system permease subunit
MDESIGGEEALLLYLTVRASLRTYVWSAGSLREREFQNIQPLELRFSATLGYESEVELERI